jgi:hypothetical protein
LAYVKGPASLWPSLNRDEWQNLVLPYLSVYQMVVLCTVNRETQQLMFNAPIDLRRNDLMHSPDVCEQMRNVCLPGPGHRETHYTNAQIHALTKRWHITSTGVKENGPSRLTFHELPSSITDVRFEDTGRLQRRCSAVCGEQPDCCDEAQRAYVIPVQLTHLDIRSHNQLYGTYEDVVVSVNTDALPTPQPASQLRLFSIDTWASRVDLSGLSECRHLEKVHLCHQDSTASLEWMRLCRRVTELELWYQAAFGCKNATSLSGVTVEQLTLCSNPRIRDLTGVDQMGHLTTLILADLGVRNLDALCGVPNLHTLTVVRCDQFTVLPVMKQVSTLTLTNCVGEMVVAGVPQLEHLMMRNMGSPEDECVFLGSCPNLRTIELNRVYDITSLRGLTPTCHLESLIIRDCPWLTTVYVPRMVKCLHVNASVSVVLGLNR